MPGRMILLMSSTISLNASASAMVLEQQLEKEEYFEELQLGAGVLCDWVEQWRGQGMSLDSCSSCISIPP